MYSLWLSVSFFPQPPHPCPEGFNEVALVAKMEAFHGQTKPNNKSSLATIPAESAEISTQPQIRYHHVEMSIRYRIAGQITSIVEVAVLCGVQSTLIGVNIQSAYWFSFLDNSASTETTIVDVQNILFTVMLASEGVQTGTNKAWYSAHLLGIQGVIRSNLSSHPLSCVKIGKKTDDPLKDRQGE